MRTVQGPGPRRLSTDVAKDGYQLPERRVEKVRTSDFVRYAGASGDFNAIHYDLNVARAAGLESVFGQGMFTAGVLAGLLSETVGVENVLRYRVRFTDRLWPGDEIICGGSVQRRYVEDGEERVDLVLEARNQDGKLLIAGEATSRLPTS